jgi:predicted esterase
MRLVLVLALLLAPLREALAEDLPYPTGTSTQEIEGLETILALPADLSAGKQASLVLVLHGAGGTASGMAGSLAPWVSDGYVVCAPQAHDVTWEPDDVRRVLAIGAHLKQVLPIDPDRVHVVGFSNGGWNLSPLAFSDDLKPRSATWVASGFNGGQVPAWAKKRLGVLALAGTEDPNVGAARQTVPALEDKVRSVEVRTQPGLDHKWPGELMPYLQWWMGVQEGRFVPGEDLNFAWTKDLPAAIAALEGAKKGGVLVYVFSRDDAASEDAKALQNETFLDPTVRFLGEQLACVKLEKDADAEAVAGLGVKETPAAVVLDRKGQVKKVLAGDVSARKLASALKSVAPLKSPPRR